MILKFGFVFMLNKIKTKFYFQYFLSTKMFSSHRKKEKKTQLKEKNIHSQYCIWIEFIRLMGAQTLIFAQI